MSDEIIESRKYPTSHLLETPLLNGLHGLRFDLHDFVTSDTDVHGDRLALAANLLLALEKGDTVSLEGANELHITILGIHLLHSHQLLVIAENISDDLLVLAKGRRQEGVQAGGLGMGKVATTVLKEARLVLVRVMITIHNLHLEGTEVFRISASDGVTTVDDSLVCLNIEKMERERIIFVDIVIGKEETLRELELFILANILLMKSLHFVQPSRLNLRRWRGIISHTSFGHARGGEFTKRKLLS